MHTDSQMRYTFIVLLLFCLPLMVFSQVERESDKQVVSTFEEFDKAKGSGFIYIRSGGAYLGYYNPVLDYWNDETSWSLNGGLMPSIGFEARLFSLLIARADLGYFSTTNTQVRNSSWGEEQITVSMIPVSISGYFPFSIGDAIVFLGGGASFTSITNAYRSPDSDRRVSGATTMPFVLVGGDYIMGRYSLGLEGRYIFGSYRQTVQLDPVSEPVTADVDISGPYVGLNLKYLF